MCGHMCVCTRRACVVRLKRQARAHVGCSAIFTQYAQHFSSSEHDFDDFAGLWHMGSENLRKLELFPAFAVLMLMQTSHP